MHTKYRIHTIIHEQATLYSSAKLHTENSSVKARLVGSVGFTMVGRGSNTSSRRSDTAAARANSSSRFTTLTARKAHLKQLVMVYFTCKQGQ